MRLLLFGSFFMALFFFQISFGQESCDCDFFNSNDPVLLYSRDSIMINNECNRLKTTNQSSCEFKAQGLKFDYYISQIQLEKAYSMLQKQQATFNVLTCKKELAFELYHNKAKYYQAINDYEKLSDFCFKALKEAENLEDGQKQIESIKQIVFLFTRMKDNKKRWEYVKQAEKLILQQENSVYTIGNNRWLAYQYENEYTKTERRNLLDSTLIFTNKAKKQALKHNISYELALIYRALEAHSYHKGNLEKGLVYIDSAIFYGKQVKGVKNLGPFYLSKAWDYLDLGHKKESIKWADTALAYQNTSDLAGRMMEYYEASDIYQNAGETNKAFESFKTYSKMRDSIFNKERIEIVNDLETKYKTELKDAEIKNLNQQQQIDALELQNKQTQINRLVILLFIALAIILFTLFITKLIQLRKSRKQNKILQLAIDKQLQLEQELSTVRDNIAQDFHDDLGNKLARISLLSNMVNNEIKTKDENVKAKVKQITEDANTLFIGTKDFIFSLKSNSDYVEELVIYLSDFGENFFNKTTVKFKVFKSISKNDKLPYYWSKQLIYIFKEALTNVLKHAQASEVKLSFTYLEHKLVIECSDNGKGMTENEFQSSNGLMNMKNRAKKIGGNLYISSTIGKGTSIKFEGKTA